MKGQFLTRSSDSPLVEAVTHWIIGTDESSIAAPDGCWDLVVLKQDGQTNILLTGQTTTAVPLHFAPGDEILTISFKASVFLAFVPSLTLLDQAFLLTKIGSSFRLASDVFEIPTFENADSFARSLMHKGHLCQNEVVKALLTAEPPAYSLRSIQRQFLQTTGMTYKYFRQIQRARQAAALLQTGNSAIDVAYETGYADQSHMSRSLKRILGQTPTVIAALPRL